MSCIGYLYRIIYLQAAPGRMKIRFAGGRRYPQLLGIYPAPPAASAGAPRTLFRTPPALLPQSHLFGELRSGRRVVWRHHGVVGPQTPFFAILLGRHVVLRTQMALEGLELLPVLQTNDKFGRDRFLHRDRRLEWLGRSIGGLARHPAESCMHLINQA